jgi:MATE family multidrug resistance protein
MGIAGAAWATVIAGFIGPLILFGLYFRRTVDSEYATRRCFKPDLKLFWRIVTFGLPSAVHLQLDVGSFALFVLLTGRLGTESLMASNIAFSINNVAFMPLIGLSIGASILVGQYQGRQDSAVAARAGWTSLKVGWFYMAIVAVTFLVFPRGYFSLFAGKGVGSVPVDQILPLGRVLLVMMAVWGMLDAVNVILSGALKGAGDTRFVMYYSVAMGWVFWIGGEFVLLFVFKAGLLAAWIWMTVYVVFMAAGFLWRYRSGAWKSIDMLGRETPLQPNRPGAEAFAVVD